MRQERINYKDYREMPQSLKSKMRNQKTAVNGMLFDSKKEAEHELVLADMKKRGEIIDYFRQVNFVLHEGYWKDGKWIKPIAYRADFMIVKEINYVSFPEQQNRKPADVAIEIHEVKGRWTREAINKRKMFEKRYPEYHLEII